jgi:hypothetical protein
MYIERNFKKLAYACPEWCSFYIAAVTDYEIQSHVITTLPTDNNITVNITAEIIHIRGRFFFLDWVVIVVFEGRTKTTEMDVTKPAKECSTVNDRAQIQACKLTRCG